MILLWILLFVAIVVVIAVSFYHDKRFKPYGSQFYAEYRSDIPTYNTDSNYTNNNKLLEQYNPPPSNTVPPPVPNNVINDISEDTTISDNTNEIPNVYRYN